MSTRCKFTCISKTIQGSGEGRVHGFSFGPISGNSAENKEFWKWTPSGRLEFSCTNPNVDFEPGKEYYIDISEAKEQ